MADIKLSELPSATTIAAADSIVLVQGGTTKKAPAGLVAISTWPVLVAEMGDGSGTAQQSISGASFATVNVTATTDTHSGFNNTTRQWTVPAGQGGTYEIAGKARPVDGNGLNGVSMGIGMHTSNTDHAAFFWDVGKPNRQGMQNVRVMTLNPGDQVRLFVYIDAGGSHNLTSGSLTIQRIR